MATNYAVRITRSYAAVERAVVAVALRCDKVLAYEHVGDATEKVHIHLMLIGVRCDKKTIQKTMKDACPEVARFKGNGDWSFKTKDAKYGDVEDSPKYITYMTKGKFDAKYNKGYSQEELDNAKANWKEPSKLKTKFDKYYQEFEMLLHGQDIRKERVVTHVGMNVVESFPGYNLVRDAALAFVRRREGALNMVRLGMATGLWVTYVYDYGIEVPKGTKMDRW